jgi:hypothetical protein
MPQRPNLSPIAAPPSREDWEAYFRQLYVRYLRNYRGLVETNCPTCKDSLPFYRSMPRRQYLMVETIPTRQDEPAELTILNSKEQPPENEIVLAQSIEPQDTRMVFLVDGRAVEAHSITRTTDPGPWADAPSPLKYRMYGCPL